MAPEARTGPPRTRFSRTGPPRTRPPRTGDPETGAVLLLASLLFCSLTPTTSCNSASFTHSIANGFCFHQALQLFSAGNLDRFCSPKYLPVPVSPRGLGCPRQEVQDAQLPVDLVREFWSQQDSTVKLSETPGAPLRLSLRLLETWSSVQQATGAPECTTEHV